MFLSLESLCYEFVNMIFHRPDYALLNKIDALQDRKRHQLIGPFDSKMMTS